MSLKIGLVGLPNVGKSSLFNALIKSKKADAKNYPFCTIEPNIASVEVKDERLTKLAKLAGSQNILYSLVDFIDIAGLTRGASKGEGLGNKFLANIKEVNVILHILRCFKDDNITHVDNNIAPIRDLETINLELLYADLETLERRMERLIKESKKNNNKEAIEDLECAQKLKEHFNDGKLASTFKDKHTKAFLRLDGDLRFLSNKEVIYIANIGDYSDITALRNHLKGEEIIPIHIKYEEELIDASKEEKKEIFNDLSLDFNALGEIIQSGFKRLGLINYFTIGPKEARAWSIKKGTTARDAAGVIHNDIKDGFIKAECIKIDDYLTHESEARVKELGLMQIVGRDYIVEDADILHFRFNN